MKKDKLFIKDKLNAESIKLPDSLSAENIVSLIENETQKSAKKKSRLPFVLSAAAAFIIIVAGVFLGGKFLKAPVVTPPESTVSPETEEKTKRDYSELSKILSANKGNFYFDSYNGIDFIVNEGATSAPSADENATSAPTSPSKPTASESDGNVNGTEDYSSLNTRTEGVDEADVMKTDGKYIYALKSDGWGIRTYACYMPYGVKTENQTFTVFDKELNKIGNIRLSSAANTDSNVITDRGYTGFFLYKDYVIFTGSETTYSGKGIKYSKEGQYWDIIDPEKVEVKTVSVVSIYDMSDKADIKSVKDIYFSGSLLSSRIVNGKIIAVSSYYPNYSVFNETDYTTFVPVAGEKDEYVPAENIKVLDEEEGNFTTVSLVDLDGGEFKVNSTSLLGQSWELYCTSENVYTYGYKTRYTVFGGWTNVLSINKVNISGASPEYTATADIEGASLNDSFSIDEYNGFLRLAVDDSSKNGGNCCKVLVLDENMKKVGETKEFAEEEYIRSARFMGNTAYVVTFKNTDPLFVIDLTDPTAPVIKGEVSLPGFSAYLHPMGENYLVGIGYDGTEDGLNGGAKISLFDISNHEKPFEADNYTISSASLNAEYKDFVKKGADGYIVNFYDWNHYTSTAGALYFTVKDGKINVEKRIDAFNNGIEIIKTIFIENTVYFLTSSYETGKYNVTAFDMMSGEKIGEAELG